MAFGVLCHWGNYYTQRSSTRFFKTDLYFYFNDNHTTQQDQLHLMKIRNQLTRYEFRSEPTRGRCDIRVLEVHSSSHYYDPQLHSNILRKAFWQWRKRTIDHHWIASWSWSWGYYPVRILIQTSIWIVIAKGRKKVWRGWCSDSQIYKIQCHYGNYILLSFLMRWHILMKRRKYTVPFLFRTSSQDN